MQGNELVLHDGMRIGYSLGRLYKGCLDFDDYTHFMGVTPLGAEDVTSVIRWPEGVQSYDTLLVNHLCSRVKLPNGFTPPPVEDGYPCWKKGSVFPCDRQRDYCFLHFYKGWVTPAEYIEETGECPDGYTCDGQELISPSGERIPYVCRKRRMANAESAGKWRQLGLSAVFVCSSDIGVVSNFTSCAYLQLKWVLQELPWRNPMLNLLQMMLRWRLM